MLHEWLPFQKHNHNTAENSSAEKALMAYFGVESTDGRPGQPDGTTTLSSGAVLEVEVCCPKPGTSSNIKNRIDEKMGRAYRQSLDDAATTIMVVFAAPNKRDMEAAVKHSRESANITWIFAYYESGRYVFFWSDGSPIDINRWREECKFQ